MRPDKERAKQVILELLRQAGGQLGKTKLFKSFWLAHLYYFKAAAGYLSDWPIVRMPKGPGIDKADRLIQELVDGGMLTVTHEARGPFTEITCRIADEATAGGLPEDAVAAVKDALGFLEGHTTESISDLSHEFSRSWNEKPNGAELDIYTDLIPDDVYQERYKELAQLKKDYEELFE